MFGWLKIFFRREPPLELPAPAAPRKIYCGHQNPYFVVRADFSWHLCRDTPEGEERVEEFAIGSVALSEGQRLWREEGRRKESPFRQYVPGFAREDGTTETHEINRP